MDGAGAELVVVEQQIFQVPDGDQSVSWNAVDGVLLQVQQHQVPRQTFGDHAEVVAGQIQTLQAVQLAGGAEEEPILFYGSDRTVTQQRN